MNNRINAQPATSSEAATKPPLPVVRARASFHWTCTKCQRTQICTRSSTHEAMCWGCGERFLIDIKEAR